MIFSSRGRMDGTERTLQASLITMNFAPQSARILVLIFLALSLYLNGSFGLPPDAKCYVPNGDIAPDNFPCFLAQGVSACCGANAVCLSTGLCAPLHFTSVSNIIRGTCTDPTWSSPSCPQYCTGRCPPLTSYFASFRIGNRS